jgi:hypothetical protein
MPPLVNRERGYWRHRCANVGYATIRDIEIFPPGLVAKGQYLPSASQKLRALSLSGHREERHRPAIRGVVESPSVEWA